MKAKKKKRTPFIDRSLLLINCLFCAAMLISYLAPVINPAKSWVVAFFGLAYPPLLLVNVIFIVYWLLRRSAYALVPLVTIAVGYNVLLNNIGFRFSGDEKSVPGAIKLLTYNVHSFKPYGQKNNEVTRHEILTMLKEQQADIITFQEFFTRKRGNYALLDSMKLLMGSKHYYFQPIHSSSSEDIGMAIFSKFPVANSGFIKLSSLKSDNQCLYVDLKGNNGKLFRVYNVHLQSISFGPEDYRYLDTVSSKGKTNMLSSKRLGSKLKNAFIKRSEQVDIIKDHAKACPHPYLIAGDFNDTPSSYVLNTMAKGMKNAFREKGSGLGRTYNGSFPNYQIDYILASQQFDVTAYKIIEKKLSDHFPLYSEVVLK